MDVTQAAWIRLLQGRTSGVKPLFGMLATVDGDRPHVRTVVVRRIDVSGAIWICSDQRSRKNDQLQRNPFAEIAIYLHQPREQFRLSGAVEILSIGDSSDQRQRLWQELSESTKASFYWPTPLGALAPEQAYMPEPLMSLPPPAFEVLILTPDRVEHLDLKPRVHQRVVWERDAGDSSWRRSDVSP